MSPKFLGRLVTLLSLGLFIGILGLACEDEGEEGAATETPAATVAPSPTPLGPGAAGIPSNPREVRGLEGILTLDDGPAIYDQRSAGEDRTGVTADTIKLGRTTGITGFLAAYEPGWGGILNAMIERINEAGGIHGRKIELITKDDASDPTVGVQATTELVEGDKIFAMFFPIGSPTHAAVHDYHVQQKVPWLFYFDASTLGQEPETSPYDFDGQNPDILSGLAMGQAVYKLAPDANAALVYADFPASQDGRTGILAAAEEAGRTLATDLSHEVGQADLTAQAQQVGASGADWLIYHGSITESAKLVGALRQAVGSNIPVMQWGWVPTGDPATDQLFDSTYQVTFLHSLYTDPNSLVWAKLSALAEEEGVPFYPLLAAQSLMVLEHLVRALELAGPDLTRQGLIEALESGFDGSWQCSVCLAPTVFGPQDHWQNETFLLVQWHQDQQSFEVLDTVGYETSEGRGIRGNIRGYECAADTCPWRE